MPIREIAYGSPEYESVKKFRDLVLRRPIALVLSDEDTKGEDSQWHFAAIENGLVLGCVILKPLSDDLIKLRQMAVAAETRGSGLGRELVRFAENAAMVGGFTEIEMNARVSARGFYEKLGYEVASNEFIEVGLPTIRMTRKLTTEK